MDTPIPQPLARYLGTYCDPNAAELLNKLPDHLSRTPPQEVALLRAQLASAIQRRSISPLQYERVTGDDEYDSQDAMQKRLREIWTIAFGDAPVAE